VGDDPCRSSDVPVTFAELAHPLCFAGAFPVATEPIRCRVHLHSSPADVYRALTTPEGRERFWAETAPEADGAIEFRFFNGQHLRSIIREQVPARRFVLGYFGGSTVTFDLEEDGASGTDLTLTETGVPVEEWAENRAGWVSVLLALKAALDLGADLRNRDPERTWERNYVDV
jgi:uncharacterized protein YndB with AHSA1/START domain